MKQLRFALWALLLISSVAYAQESKEEDEIITDFGTDEYIYVPKMTLNLGFRGMTGPKSSFTGHGSIAATTDPGPATGSGITRNYHDGYVGKDSRLITNANGDSVPVADDGKTNTWSYLDNDQITADGYVAMHNYSAVIGNTGTIANGSKSNYGLELSVYRDMGKLFNTRVTWGIFAGMAVNGINVSVQKNVQADVTTLTDLYSLYGQTPPAAPYTAPSSLAQPVLDVNGSPVLNSDGTAQTQAVDNTTLISNQPLSRTSTTSTNSTSVTNQWKLKGAFMTFRVGPTVFVPLFHRFTLSVSAGPAVVYSGTNYSVIQSLQADTADPITDTVSDGASEILTGYYVDATLNFAVTDLAGLYLGGVYQSTGSYTQEITSSTSSYATRIDLSHLQGLRAGMTFRF